MKDCVLLRYGEIGLKSNQKRSYFEKQYEKGLQAVLDPLKIAYTIKNYGGRFVVFGESTKIKEVVKMVPGVQGVSAGTVTDFDDYEGLLSSLFDFLKEKVEGKTFGIKVRTREGKHDFRSQQLEKDLGARLVEHSKGVDLSNGDVTIVLEIRDQECFVYFAVEEGMGGMPAGTGGKVLCLFSGGIDSPVAAYQMLKRGCQVDFLFVNLLGDSLLKEVGAVYEEVKKYCIGYAPKMHLLDGRALVDFLKDEVEDKLRQFSFKVVMYKLASALAQKGYLGVCTGEALLQKSTQTTESLAVLDTVTDTIFFRPLLTMDKVEIIALARKLGTMDSSEKVKEYCNLSEGKVITKPSLETLKKLPDFSAIIKDTLATHYVHTGMLVVDDVEVTLDYKQPITLIDMRVEAMRKRQPEEAEVMSKETVFKDDDQYLLFCEYGLRSEHLAQELAKKGKKVVGMSYEHFLLVKKHLNASV